MGHQNVVDLGFDVEAISAEKKQVYDLFVDLFGKLEEYDGTRINPLKNGGLTDLRKSIQDGAKAMSEFQQIAAKYNQTVTEQAQKQYASKKALEDLTAEQREAKRIQDQLAVTQAKIGASSTEAAKELAQQKLQLQQLTTENKNAAKEALGLVSAYQKLEAEFKAASAAAASIGIAQGTSSEEYVAASKKANDLNDQLKKLDADAGKFGRNVGNYPGAFKEAFGVLGGQLEELRAEFAKTGGADSALGQNIKTIESLLDKLNQGFNTTRQESRAFAEAVTQVGLALGDKSKEFLEFNKAVGNVQNSINDLKAATKYQASDAKLIVGLADAASTLAGGFGAAQAAAALFAGEDENLQKQMAQFQQLLVLINGLQAVANGLQTESAGIQLLLSVRNGLVNAAKSTQLLITTRLVQSIAAESVATEVNAAAKEADTAATVEQTVAEEAQTVAVVENTGAIEGNAAANIGAAGATKSLTTSFVAGGIAVLAIGAGVALALLTAKLIGYGQQTGLTIKQQEQMADAMKTANDIVIEQTNFIKELDSATRKYYENQLSLSQAAGQNQYRQFALQKQIADAEKESAQEQIDALGANNHQQAELAGTIQILNNRRSEAIRIEKELLAIPTKDLTGNQEDQLKAAQANVEFYQKQIDGVRSLYDAGDKARKDLFAATQKQGQLQIQEAKFSEDEQRKLTLETIKLEVNAQKVKNSKLLSDARSTLVQRLAAIRSNRDQEKKSAEGDLSAAKDQARLGQITPAELATALRQANAAKAAADREYLAERHNEERAAYERDRDANLAAYRVQIDQQIKIAQDLQQGKVANTNPLEPAPKASLQDRLKGLSDEYEARRNLLNAELKVELDKEGQTQAEKTALYEKYGADIADLGREFKKTYIDLEIEAQQQSLAEWETYYERRKTQIDENEIDQIQALNEAQEKGLINLRKYNRERQKIEDEATLAKAQTAVQNAYLEVNATKEGTKERADAETRLADTVKTLTNQVHSNRIHTQDTERDKILNTLSDVKAGYQATADAVGTILDIGYENQKAKLQDLEASQQKNYEQQVAQVQGTTASEEEKAARLKVLESQRFAQKEINDRKERQLEVQRAQFEKASSITSVILDTTKAIVGFLHDPGGFAGIALSVAAGITGAAQLAKAVATQVPHYKIGAGVNGRPLHPGGLFVAGDGGEQELISEPGKRPYLSPAVPTLLDASPMTSIVPLSMLDEMSRMWVTDRGILSYQAQDNTQQLVDLKNAIVWQTGILKESAKNNRPRVTVVNNIGKDLAHAAWVKKNVFD